MVLQPTVLAVASSRLIAIYYGTMVPNPCGTWYDGTVPSVIGCRHRHKYQETIATLQWPILVVPDNYLHARMIPYVPTLETIIRNPNLGIRKAGTGFLAMAIDLAN